MSTSRQIHQWNRIKLKSRIDHTSIWMFNTWHRQYFKWVEKDRLYMRGRKNTEWWESDCFITVPAIYCFSAINSPFTAWPVKMDMGPLNMLPLPVGTLVALTVEGTVETHCRKTRWLLRQAWRASVFLHYLAHMVFPGAKCLQGAAFCSIWPPHVFSSSWFRLQQHSWQPQKEQDCAQLESQTFSAS